MRSLLTRCVLTLFAASALLAPFHASQTQAAGFTPDPRFGAVEAWHAPADASAIGVGWERLTFWWDDLQPAGPTSWNYFATGHDGYINRDLAQGRQLVGLLIHTPKWAALNPKQGTSSVPRGLYLRWNAPGNYWGNFVYRIVTHYRGRITDWIVWNEVDIPAGKWSTWKGSVADYAQLMRVAWQAAHAANPAAQIGLFGDPYWYDHGAFFRAMLADLCAMPSAARTGCYFDFANLHLYNRPRDYETVIPLYRSWLAAKHLAKPIWIGETNAIPYNDPARHFARSGFFCALADQGDYVLEVMALGIALGVARIEINRMIDGADFIAGGEPFGMIRNDGTHRPAYAAFAFAAHLFRGASGGSIEHNALTGTETVRVLTPRGVVSVIWDRLPTPTSVTLRVPSGTQAYTVSGQLVSRATGSAWRIGLSGATGNTNPADPTDYVMGGHALVIVPALP